jgi:hypothetical protein
MNKKMNKNWPNSPMSPTVVTFYAVGTEDYSPLAPYVEPENDWTIKSFTPINLIEQIKQAIREMIANGEIEIFKTRKKRVKKAKK